MLKKELPSIRLSAQLEYAHQFSTLEKHESVVPLLHAPDKKANGELDFLMAEVADVSQRGRENGNLDSDARVSQRVAPKKLGTFGSSEGAASTSGIASQTASGVLSGSGVLNARQVVLLHLDYFPTWFHHCMHKLQKSTLKKWQIFCLSLHKRIQR